MGHPYNTILKQMWKIVYLVSYSETRTHDLLNVTHNHKTKSTFVS